MDHSLVHCQLKNIPLYTLPYTSISMGTTLNSNPSATDESSERRVLGLELWVLGTFSFLAVVIIVLLVVLCVICGKRCW